MSTYPDMLFFLAIFALILAVVFAFAVIFVLITYIGYLRAQNQVLEKELTQSGEGENCSMSFKTRSLAHSFPRKRSINMSPTQFEEVVKQEMIRMLHNCCDSGMVFAPEVESFAQRMLRMFLREMVSKAAYGVKCNGGQVISIIDLDEGIKSAVKDTLSRL